MLTVVTWLWAAPPGYRSQFRPEHVNAVARMVQRHYPDPHRVICVTDITTGLDPSITVVAPWHDFAHVQSPHGEKNPSCYRRLRMFDPAIGVVFGERFVSLDLDIVVTGDLRPLWNRPEPFVAWGDTNPLPGSHYNGSMILMTAGARPKVWTDFNPRTSPQVAKAHRCFGSDQGWISYVLGPGEPKWTTRDGVYSYRNHLEGHGQRLPPNARIVICHGRHDPWTGQLQQLPWVREHYGDCREAVAV